MFLTMADLAALDQARGNISPADVTKILNMPMPVGKPAGLGDAPRWKPVAKPAAKAGAKPVAKKDPDAELEAHLRSKVDLDALVAGYAVTYHAANKTLPSGMADYAWYPDLSGKHSRRMLAFANAQFAAAQDAIRAGDVQKALQITASDPWHPNANAQMVQNAISNPQSQSTILSRFNAIVNSMKDPGLDQGTKSQIQSTFQQFVQQQAPAAASGGSGGHSFQDVVGLVNQWNQLIQQNPSAAQNPQVQQLLQSQTPNNPPAANTMQGIIQYYTSHTGAGQAYIDRDYNAFSAALQQLQQIVGAGASSGAGSGPTQLSLNTMLQQKIAEQQCSSQGGTWDPNQGQNVPGFGPTGACVPAPVAPIVPPASVMGPAPVVVPAPVPVDGGVAPPPAPGGGAPPPPPPSGGGGGGFGGGGGGGGGGFGGGGGESFGGGGGPSDSSAAPPPPGPAPSAAGPPSWLLPVGIAVGVLGVAGVGAYFMFFRKKNEPQFAMMQMPAPAAAPKS